MVKGENFIKKGSPPEFIEADGKTYVPLPDGGVLEVRGPAVYHPPEAVPQRYQEALASRRLFDSYFDLTGNSAHYERQPLRDERLSDIASTIDLDELRNPRNPRDDLSYLNPLKKEFYSKREISPPKRSSWIEKEDKDK